MKSRKVMMTEIKIKVIFLIKKKTVIDKNDHDPKGIGSHHGQSVSLKSQKYIEREILVIA